MKLITRQDLVNNLIHPRMKKFCDMMIPYSAISLFRTILNWLLRARFRLDMIVLQLLSSPILKFIFNSLFYFLWGYVYLSLVTVEAMNYPIDPPQPPEASESGSNCPYSGWPARITRVEANSSAECSATVPSAEENTEATSSSSSRSSSRKSVIIRMNPLERFVKAHEEEVRIKHWLEHEATENAKRAYEDDARKKEEEERRKDEAERQARREYDRMRYEKRKKQK